MENKEYKCFGCKCTPCCNPKDCEEQFMESIKRWVGLGKEIPRPEIFTIRNVNYKENELKEAIKVLQKHLKEDKSEGSYYSWQANIAMAFVDEFGRHPGEYTSNVEYPLLIEIANQAAINFLDLLIKE